MPRRVFNPADIQINWQPFFKRFLVFGNWKFLASHMRGNTTMNPPIAASCSFRVSPLRRTADTSCSPILESPRAATHQSPSARRISLPAILLAAGLREPQSNQDSAILPRRIGLSLVSCLLSLPLVFCTPLKKRVESVLPKSAGGKSPSRGACSPRAARQTSRRFSISRLCSASHQTHRSL